MLAEILEKKQKDIIQARTIGLSADIVFPALQLPIGGVYASYVWDTHWLLGEMSWEELKRAFLMSAGPLPVSLSHFPHQGVAQRLQETRQLKAAGLPFALQFAATVDAIDFGDRTAVDKLIYILQQVHEAAAEDVDYFLHGIAELLQNQLVLRSGDSLYRITELEFYYWSRAHLDMYTHKGPEQRRMGRWYFNEADCLDLTFGSEELNYWGGILLRGLQRLPAEFQGKFVAPVETCYIHGPRNVLQELIANMGYAFSGTDKGLSIENAPSGALSPQQLLRVRRYGLRHKPEDINADFLNRGYRFLIDPAYVSGLRDKRDVVRQLGLLGKEAKAILGYYPAAS